MKKKLTTALTGVCLLLALAIPVHAAVMDTGFSDVASDAWYAEAVTYCRDNGLISGTTATTFSPDMATSRAMLVTILYRQAGSPTVSRTADYTDVPSGSWYADALNWASAQEIVGGYSDGRFGPNDSITREQFITILWRGESSPAPSHTGIPFTDQSAISAYAIDAVAWGQENGIISGGDDGRFSPHETATRAQTAVMLYRWLNSGGGEEVPVAPTPDDESIRAENTMIDLKITVAGQVFTAKLYDNESTQALLHQLPLTVRMDELNGNEKYYFMPIALPTSSERPGEIHTGDFMLYGSDCLVLFYKNFSSSYSYTRLGYIEDVEGFAQAVGNGSVSVSFEYEM